MALLKCLLLTSLAQGSGPRLVFFTAVVNDLDVVL